MQSLFDIPAFGTYKGAQPQQTQRSIESRDEGIERAENATDAVLLAKYHAALVEVAERQEFLTIDDVDEVAQVSLNSPTASGGVMPKGQRDGIVEPTDRFIPSRRPTCHRTPRRIWKSLIYKGGAE